MPFATRSVMPPMQMRTQAPLNWNLPSAGVPGVSLGYNPQQQVIGDPRNAAVIAAATNPAPAPVPVPVSPLAQTQPSRGFRYGGNADFASPRDKRGRSSDSRAGGYASGRGLY